MLVADPTPWFVLLLSLWQEYKTHKESYVKKFELTKLPPYLILCIKVSPHITTERDDLHCTSVPLFPSEIYKEQFLY